MPASRSARGHAVEMVSPLNKPDHLIRRMDRERMLRKARPRRNIRCHIASQGQLSIGRFRKQGDYQVLERYHANAQLHQLSIGQCGDIGMLFFGHSSLLRAPGSRATLAVPPRKREVGSLRRV